MVHVLHLVHGLYAMASRVGPCYPGIFEPVTKPWNDPPQGIPFTFMLASVEDAHPSTFDASLSPIHRKSASS